MNSVTRPDRRLFALIAVCGSTLLSLLLVEAAFRVIRPSYLPLEELWDSPQPYVMFGPFAPGRTEPSKQPGERRVFVLGGSTVELPVGGRPPLPELLEEAIEARGIQHVRVFNYGVTSYNSAQELTHLVFNVLNSEPDVVVMYGGGNDILDPFFADPRPGYPFNFAAYESNVFSRRLDDYPAFAVLAYGSGIMRYLFRDYFAETFTNLSTLRARAGFGTEDWRAAIARTYVSNLEKASRICHEYGVEFAVFFQPLLAYKEHVSAGPEAQSYTPDMVDHARRTRELMYQELAKTRARTPFRFHDVSDLYKDEQSRVFDDPIHLSDAKYNVRIAERITDDLLQIIVTP